MVKVRFAPSPTGYIHIGNTRIALFNWLFSQQNQGKFILRFDDTDVERSKQEYIDAIGEDLAWLGITPDEVFYQSKRFSRYDEVCEALKAQGLLYPCYETAEELERRRKIRLSRKLPPIYGREALKLSAEEKAAFEAEGRQPHWRFLLPNFKADPFDITRTEICWDDSVRGPQTIDLASMSDPVLIREDGTYLYTLPSVVDDIDMGISHIIRGDDHVTNTGAQLAIFDALGATRPIFGHINLLTTISGEGLSKRNNALSIRSLRQLGFEPMSVANLAVLIGTSENVFAYEDMAQLADHFTIKAASKSSAKFDPDDLLNLNRAIIHHMSFSNVKSRLPEMALSESDSALFWDIVKNNITKVEEASAWVPIVTDNNLVFDKLSDDDKAFLSQAISLLPPTPWDNNTWKLWTDALKGASGRKGKALFEPLRVALTGEASGPELAKLLPLMGQELVLKRLEGAA